MDLMPLGDLAVFVLMAAGVSLVITCTKAGYPIRYLWASSFRARPLRWVWKIAHCPHCNSWWTGFVISALLDRPPLQVLQVAFTTCGVVYMLQKAMTRHFVGMMNGSSDGWIGELRGVDLEPEDDFEEILGLTEGEEADGDEG